ncbi:MAG: glycosyltransferase [Deltaproteobacteria bacterium]|nr:glycosyltransferase [Deltaproteobacteria bacterium]
MLKKPKVTVYITNYNYGRFLNQAIQSVFSQTMMDWELIIIDDGSTDDSLSILDQYRQDPKIRIIEQENKGLNITNNIALRLSNGQFIVRLDADDYMDENMLLVLSNVLETKPQVGLVYPDYYHVDENGDVIEIVRRQKVGEEVELLDLPAHGACTMFRKECLLEIGGYCEDFKCQDGYDIWLRATDRFQPYNVNIPLFYYRRHPASLTKHDAKILETRRRIKQRFVDTSKGSKRPRVLGLIPVVSRSVYPQAEPFVELAGKPLLWYSLHEATKCNGLERLVLASDDKAVLEYGASFPEVEPLLRPQDLSKSTSRMHAIVRYVLNYMADSEAYRPDAVCILYANTPLRRARHIDKAIDTLTIFDVDSVISVEEKLDFFYRHDRKGLKRISNSHRNVRLEREAIYKENGAIYLSRTEIIEEGRLLGDRVGHIVMLPWEGIKITDQFRLWMTEKIMLDWVGRSE